MNLFNKKNSVLLCAHLCAHLRIEKKQAKKKCFPMCICMCILFAHKENEQKNAPRLSTKGTPNLKF